MKTLMIISYVFYTNAGFTTTVTTMRECNKVQENIQQSGTTSRRMVVECIPMEEPNPMNGPVQ